MRDRLPTGLPTGLLTGLPTALRRGLRPANWLAALDRLHLSLALARRRVDPSHAGRWLGEGLVAAGLGLAVLAALVLLLWTLSPYPDSGAGTALRLAADLWLLAHGTELVRSDTLSGAAAPVGVVPLLLAALPGWLLFRAVRTAHLPAGRPAAEALDPAEGPRAALWVAAGYLLAGAAVVLCTVGADPLGPRPLSAALWLPLFTLLTTAVATWAVVGWPPDALRAARRLRGRLPGNLTPVLNRRRIAAGLRAAGAGAAAMCCAGALLAVGALALHAEPAQAAFAELSGVWSGRLAMLLLLLALAPNAAVWAAAYGLGPGFALGGGSVVAPLGVTGEPRPPEFPLLVMAPRAALEPPEFAWAVAGVVPVTGVLVVAWFAARAAVPVRGERATASGLPGTALVALFAAAGAGVCLGALAALAGGPLGTDALRAFGPDPWLTGLAAAGWTAGFGLPLTLVLRWWRLRRPRFVLLGLVAAARAVWACTGRPTAALARRVRRRGRAGADPDTGTRRTRWAAYKEASGGLMADIPDAPVAPPAAGHRPPAPPAPRPRPAEADRDAAPDAGRR